MNPLVEVRQLTKSFHGRKSGDVKILQGIDMVIGQGETLCVVGESGCGKTTFGKILAGLIPYSGGSYTFEGQEVSSLKGKAWKKVRKEIQMIHQNPYESLNPSMMVFDIISAPLRYHRKIKGLPTEEVAELLEMVGLTPVEDFIDKYPGNLSGGQRQRVSIARVLSMEPKLIVVDEATSMIDMSMRISLLATLKRIQDELNVAYVYITHDLALGRYFAWNHRLAVMYLGRIIETATTQAMFDSPQHPYTKALLSAGAAEGHENYDLKGVDIPSFTNIPKGCPLSPRCPESIDGLCTITSPDLIETAPGHRTACHLFGQSVAVGDMGGVDMGMVDVDGTGVRA